MLLFTASNLLVSAALAEAPNAEVAARAEEVFRAGRAAMKAGDYVSACPRFERSLALQPALGTLLNLAICEEKLGHLLLSVEHFERFVEQAAIDDERRPLVIGYLSEVKGRLPRLTVELGANAAPNVQIQLDGAALARARLGNAMPVDPGAHVIAIVHPAPERRLIRIEILERQSVVQVIEFAQTAEAPSKSVARERRSRPAAVDRSSSALPYWIAGAGLASLAVGAVAGVTAIRKKQTVDEQCVSRDSGTLCSREGLDAIQQGKTFATVSSVASAFGLAAIGVGGYLHFSTHPRAPGSPSHAAAKAPLTLELAIERTW